MDNFKTFYNEKKGKYILFFGFYIIFFIFLAALFRTTNTNKPKEENKETVVEKITTYDISNLINNDYQYTIVVKDNEEEINFSGTKNNIDYANFENKYFLDIYNINQLLKKSKLVKSENNTLTYELSNQEINEILLTNKENGVNKIDVIVNDKTEINKISFDLSNYLGKDVYQITINYIVGEENENRICFFRM